MCGGCNKSAVRIQSCLSIPLLAEQRHCKCRKLKLIGMPLHARMHSVISSLSADWQRGRPGQAAHCRPLSSTVYVRQAAACLCRHQSRNPCKWSNNQSPPSPEACCASACNSSAKERRHRRCSGTGMHVLHLVPRRAMPCTRRLAWQRSHGEALQRACATLARTAPTAWQRSQCRRPRHVSRRPNRRAGRGWRTRRSRLRRRPRAAAAAR